MTDLKTAATRAADWLEAHPDNHIARALATDADGHKVRPNDDNAVCFCALGRLGREMGFEFRSGDDYGPFMLSEIDVDPIYEANDKDTPIDHRDSFYAKVANPAGGINALRALAKDS